MLPAISVNKECCQPSGTAAASMVFSEGNSGWKKNRILAIDS